MNEFRAALQAIVEADSPESYIAADVAAKALLARPEPDIPAVNPIAHVINNNQPGWTNIIETAPNITLDVGSPLYDRKAVTRLASALAGAIHRHEDARAEPEPRITREEGEKLLDRYFQSRRDPDTDSTKESEACLAAMLRTEADGAQKTATPIPHMKPRTVTPDENSPELARQWQPMECIPEGKDLLLLAHYKEGGKSHICIGHCDGNRFYDSSGSLLPFVSAWHPLPPLPDASDGEK